MKATVLALTLGWVFASVQCGQAQTYTFSTIAGQAGIGGHADGTNADAQFYYPSELAVDRDGAVYVSDLLNHTIRKVTPAGTNWVVTTLAGLPTVPGGDDGTNSDARFNRPNGIKVDQTGRVFVVDHYNNTIRQLTQSGTNWVVTTIAGLAGQRGGDDGTNSAARFYGPTGIAVDGAGHLYVVDTANFTIRGISQQGAAWMVSTLAGSETNYGFMDGLNGFAQFDYPYGGTLSAAGVLYVTDWGNNAIRQVAPSGSNWLTTTIAGFSTDMGTNDGPATTAKFNGPNGIAVDSDNNILVTDQMNSTIRKLSLKGGGGGWTVSTLAGAPGQRGTNDGVGSVARFAKPWGLALDDGGTLFVADYLNHTIRMGVPSSVSNLKLGITRTNNQVVISWPIAATNYVLQTGAALSPAATWLPLTNGIAVSGSRRFFTNNLGAGPAFFRLRKQ